MKENRKYWVALNQVRGMTPDLFYRLVDYFEDPSEVWAAPEKELDRFRRVPARRAKEINDPDNFSLEHEVRQKVDEKVERPVPPTLLDAIIKLRKKEDGEQEIERAERIGSKIFNIEDEEYPDSLKKISTPPPVIYVKGEIPQDEGWAVAVVGTRKCTGYGRDFAFRLSSALAKKGFTIVSGLAAGIDSAGHRGALHAGGKTVAVFGTGIDTVSPKSNSALAQEIEETGALISQFPIGAIVEKWFFPLRNEIISGLSRGVVVVEAGERSGAMITARVADEQSRKVFAVPGDVNKHTAKGPHWLLKNGAYLVECADDVTDIIGAPKRQVELAVEAAPENKDYEKALDFLSERPAQFDEICGMMEKSASEIQSMLTIMEMKGLIRRLPGSIYVRN